MFDCVQTKLKWLGRYLPRRVVLGTRVWGQGDEGPPGQALVCWGLFLRWCPFRKSLFSNTNVSWVRIFSCTSKFVIFTRPQFSYNLSRPFVPCKIKSSSMVDREPLRWDCYGRPVRFSSNVLSVWHAARETLEQSAPQMIRQIQGQKSFVPRPLALIAET